VTVPPAVQADEAVGQAGHKVLVVVARPEHQVAVDGQDPQGVQQRHLLGDRLVGSAELVEYCPVQAVVDGVEGETLGTPLGLEEEEKENRGRGVRQRGGVLSIIYYRVFYQPECCVAVI